MRFFSYPISVLPPLDQHILLVMEGAEELCVADADYGLLILDSTWRYLNKMVQFVEKDSVVVKRTLPSLFKTAYPRRQEDCVDPERGLSSIEALYVAYHLLGRDTTQLLDTYYWKDQFQQINSHLL